MTRGSELMTSTWRKEVFTAREAAQVLHVSLSTIYRMIEAGILVPAEITLGSGIRNGTRVIPSSELEHYVDSLRRSARRRVDERDAG